MNDRREVSCDCFICDQCGCRVSFDTWNYARSYQKKPICQNCFDKAEEKSRREEQSRRYDNERRERMMPPTPKGREWWEK